MRISDWSSDGCSSDLAVARRRSVGARAVAARIGRDFIRPPTVEEPPEDLGKSHRCRPLQLTLQRQLCSRAGGSEIARRSPLIVTFGLAWLFGHANSHTTVAPGLGPGAHWRQRVARAMGPGNTSRDDSL